VIDDSGEVRSMRKGEEVSTLVKTSVGPLFSDSFILGRITN
jgi:hypothetical protein